MRRCVLICNLLQQPPVAKEVRAQMALHTLTIKPEELEYDPKDFGGTVAESSNVSFLYLWVLAHQLWLLKVATGKLHGVPVTLEQITVPSEEAQKVIDQELSAFRSVIESLCLKHIFFIQLMLLAEA
jgi:hypothetical protein